MQPDPASPPLRVVVVDADGSVDEVAERVWAAVRGVVEAVAVGADALRVVG